MAQIKSANQIVAIPASFSLSGIMRPVVSGVFNVVALKYIPFSPEKEDNEILSKQNMVNFGMQFVNSSFAENVFNYVADLAKLPTTSSANRQIYNSIVVGGLEFLERLLYDLYLGGKIQFGKNVKRALISTLAEYASKFALDMTGF